MIALVLTALAWSFFGRVDVIVTGQGTLTPASEVRRFYAPVDGELANLYVAEGAAGIQGRRAGPAERPGCHRSGEQRHAGAAEARECGTGVAAIARKRRRCWSTRLRTSGRQMEVEEQATPEAERARHHQDAGGTESANGRGPHHCRGCQAGAGRGPARAGKVRACLRDSRRRRRVAASGRGQEKREAGRRECLPRRAIEGHGIGSPPETGHRGCPECARSEAASSSTS